MCEFGKILRCHKVREITSFDLLLVFITMQANAYEPWTLHVEIIVEITSKEFILLVIEQPVGKQT